MSDKLAATLALPLVLLAACELPPIDGPALSVYQLDADEGCWRLCEGEGAGPKPSGDCCDGDCAAPTVADPGCEFTSGYDSVFVVAQYELALDKTGDRLNSKLELFYDEESVASPSAAIGPTENDDVATQAVAAAVFSRRLDASFAEQLRMVIGTDQYLSSTEIYPLTPPSFPLAFETCAAPCSMPAGVGTATLVFSPPRVADQTRGELIMSVGGQSVTSEPFDYDPKSNFPIRKVVTVPKQPYEDWSIRARIGDFVSDEITASLTPLEPVALTVSSDHDSCSMVDFNAALPRAVRGEWELGCRTYNVLVSAPSRATDEVTVTIDEGAGSLGTGGSAQTLTLDAEGCAVVPLVLPEPTIAPANFGITARLDDGPTTRRDWQLLPTPVLVSELFGPGGDIVISAEGTPEVAISGNLIAPGQSSFEVGRNAALVIEATAAAPAGDPPCEPPLPTQNIRCDMELVSGPNKGGCQMSPSAVVVQTDGSLSFALEESKCFLGVLKIGLWAIEIPPPEPGQCMREVLMVGANPAEVSSLPVTYVEPAIPAMP